jgi:hypothetical protein
MLMQEEEVVVVEEEEGGGVGGQSSSSADGATGDTVAGGRPRFELLRGGGAPRPERARALAQAKEQGFKVPISKNGPLPPDWAIGKAANGSRASGKDFVLVCVLARAHCLTSGGKPGDVIMYKKDGVARVLLSPDGADAFERVDQDMTPDKLQKLRRKPKIDAPPCALVNELLRAGLTRSLDSGIALPPRVPHDLFTTWWRHHILSIDAMKPNATEGTITSARKATDALHETPFKAEMVQHK